MSSLPAIAGTAQRFASYPEYRDTGSAWVGRIPSHWLLSRVKHVFSVFNGSTPATGSPEFWDGDIPWVTPEDLGILDGPVIRATRRCITLEGYRSCGTRLVPAGSLVLSTRAPIGHVAIAGVDLCTNQGCRSLVPRSPLASLQRFTYYQLLAANTELASWGQGSTFQELAKSRLDAVLLVAPPASEQRAIAAFLDRETAKIDTLVAKKERLIELLQEKRAALIARAVTKGLDPNVLMKDAGVEWLGAIPAHWSVVRSRRLFRQRDTRALASDQQLTASQEYGVIPQSEFMEREGRRVVQVLKGADILKHVEPNDFVISMRSFQGGIELSNCRGAISSAYVVLVPNSSVHTGYFARLLKSKLYIQALQSTSNLVRDGQALRFANFALVDLPAVPLSEQRALATYMDQETSRSDALAAKVTRAIELLKEYRTALISAAVTGKIDVREEAA